MGKEKRSKAPKKGLASLMSTFQDSNNDISTLSSTWKEEIRAQQQASINAELKETLANAKTGRERRAAKLQAAINAKKDSIVRTKKAKTDLMSSTADLLDALPTEDNTEKVPEVKMKKAADAVKAFTHIATHPAYKQDPFAALRAHISNNIVNKK